MSQGKPKNKSHWDANHPGERARDKLRKEIKAGRIVKPDICELCGSEVGVSTSEIIGHHWRGYDYPLDVWWICRSCNTHPQLTHDGSQTLEQMRQVMGKLKPKQTDNSHLQAKLDLRRLFLDKYHHNQPPDVLDCCQGSGTIWEQLKQEYVLNSYWGVDYKKKKGRMAIDSRRLLSSPGLIQNVIDIDTYGSPWDHWLALIKNIQRPTTVFLTIGSGMVTAMQPAATGAHLIGFPPSTPTCLQAKMGCQIAPRILLTRCEQYDTILAEAIEAECEGAHARYIGCHLIPG